MRNRYYEKRFGTPLGEIQHRQQVSFVCEHLQVPTIHTILEIGVGTGRVTAEVRTQAVCMGIDTSEEMLLAARGSLARNGNTCWEVALADAFDLPLPNDCVDGTFAFRVIRHLRAEERSRIYSEIRRVLRAGGHFIFDAPNIGYGERRGIIYDECWTKAGIRSEVAREGFVVRDIRPNIRYFGIQRIISSLGRIGLRGLALRTVSLVEDLKVKPERIYQRPLEWLVLCQK